MAILKQPDNPAFGIDELAPVGTYVATCLAIHDQFGVERPKYDQPGERQKLDVTRFLFGFRAGDGKLYRVQSQEFRISGNTKSNLFKFLNNWLGRTPEYGWDYCSLVGAGAMVSVTHRLTRDGSRTFAVLNSVAPVIEQLRHQVMPVAVFDEDPPED
jgi:hypothetical protein